MNLKVTRDAAAVVYSEHRASCSKRLSATAVVLGQMGFTYQDARKSGNVFLDLGTGLGDMLIGVSHALNIRWDLR